MYDFFIILLFFLEFFILNFISWKQFHNLFEPGFLLGIPYFCNILLLLILNPYLGYKPFNVKSLWCPIVGFFIFWSVLQILYLFFLPASMRDIRKQKDIFFYCLPRSFIIFLTCGIPIAFCFFLTQGDMSLFGKKDMGIFFIGGLWGRIFNIFICTAPLIIWDKRSLYFKLILFLPLFIMTASMGSKTHMLNIFLSIIFMGLLLNRIKINFKVALFTVFFSVSIFLLYYFILIFSVFDSFSEFLIFGLRHFCDYFFCSPMYLSVYFDLGSPPAENWAPILGFVRLIWNIFFSECPPVSPVYNMLNISLYEINEYNTCTFWGLQTLLPSPYLTVFYYILFACISGMIFIVWHKHKTPFIQALLVCNSFILFCGWFSFAYVNPRPLEQLFLLAMLAFLYSFFPNAYQINQSKSGDLH